MARSNPHTADASSATASSTSSRISKARLHQARSSSIVTRRRSKMAADASSTAASEDVVEDFQVVAGSSRAKNKGKAPVPQDQRNADMEMALGLHMSEYGAFCDDEMALEEEEDAAEVCPITDKDTKPFDIMSLPTEIRLEIFRACLTRPYSILLSKREKPHDVDGDLETNNECEVLLPKYSSGNAANARQPDIEIPQPGTTTSRRALSVSSLRQRGDLPGGRRMRLVRTTNRPGGSRDVGRGLLPASVNPYTTRGGGQTNPRRKICTPVSEPPRNQTQDPLLVNILRVSKQIYKEARSVIYSENIFTLDLNTANYTLGCLHQRSRRQIKHIELEIPTYNEILERFQEAVRLQLRYCSGLKTFVIHMPFTLPGADGSGTTGNTTVYANGFDILRWLPQECAIVLKGNICTEITTVVNKHLHLAKSLDKLAYARRQLISNETGPAAAQ